MAILTYSVILFFFKSGFKTVHPLYCQMATKIFLEEQLNYFRVCHIATDILPQPCDFCSNRNGTIVTRQRLGNGRTHLKMD